MKGRDGSRSGRLRHEDSAPPKTPKWLFRVPSMSHARKDAPPPLEDLVDAAGLDLAENKQQQDGERTVSVSGSSRSSGSILTRRAPVGKSISLRSILEKGPSQSTGKDELRRRTRSDLSSRTVALSAASSDAPPLPVSRSSPAPASPPSPPNLPAAARELLASHFGHRVPSDASVEPVKLHLLALRAHLESLLRHVLSSQALRDLARHKSKRHSTLMSSLFDALGHAPSRQTIEAAQALWSNGHGLQEAAFDKCVALTVDAFVACLYRRLRVMSMRGYRSSISEFDLRYGEHPVVRDSDRVALPAALSMLVDAFGAVELQQMAGPPDCTRVVLPVFPIATATVPKGLSGQWLSQAFSVELYKWLTRVCWEALGIQCRCPDTGCARGDDGRALWAIDVAWHADQGVLHGTERLAPANFSRTDALLRVLLCCPAEASRLVWAGDPGATAGVGARGSASGAEDTVANLVNFDVIHGSGSNDFGTIIASFPVSRVPDVFFALSGADLTQLLEEWRTLRL